MPKEIFEIAFLFVIGKEILPCERTTKFCCQYSCNETLLVCFGEVNFRCGYWQVLPGLESRLLIYFITVYSTAFSLGTTVMQPLYQLFTYRFGYCCTSKYQDHYTLNNIAPFIYLIIVTVCIWHVKFILMQISDLFRSV